MKVQNISNRKPSGGKYRHDQPKKLKHMEKPAANTTIGERKLRVKRRRGGSDKYITVQDSTVNVVDGDEAYQATIEDVTRNPASRHLARRNIITKGAVLETDEGLVKVTNRPGQEGTINGVPTEN